MFSLNTIQVKSRMRFCHAIALDVCHVALISQLQKEMLAKRKAKHADMMKKTQETGVSHCRFASRVLPIDHTCFCKLEDMRALAARVIPAAFADGERVTFSVQYEHRAAQKLDRGEVIDAFAKAVPERHGVDLGSPQRTILVQLVKSTCAVAVVEGFKRLCKYNLKTLTGLDECGRPLKPKPSADGQPGEEGEEATGYDKRGNQ